MSTHLEDNFKIYLANLVAVAMTAMNARADEILEEIEMNHWENMYHIDAMERANEREHHIAWSLLPFHSFEAWWDSLPDNEAASWIEDYQQYQWGPNGGEEFDGDFTMAVFSFLNSRDRQVPFCSYCDSRHEDSGSCMGALH